MSKRNLQLEELKKVYGKISPFEFKNKLIDLAKDKKSARSLLDAGRGNPNWTASTPRDAYFTFGHFAVSETRHTFCKGDLAGMPTKKGIYNRFLDYVKSNPNSPGINLLSKIIDFGVR